MAIRYPMGWSQPITQYGLNPSRLTSEQAQYSPVLFLHGDLHNSSAALPLAEYFQKRHYKGPIFTVNYPTPVTNHSKLVIINRINEIKSYYTAAGQSGEQIKLNLFGHSRGSWMITSPSPA